MDSSKTPSSSSQQQQHDQNKPVSLGDSFRSYVGITSARFEISDPRKRCPSNQQQNQNEGNPLSKASESLKAVLNAHAANPGPAIPKDFDVPEEGTKEERRARAQELNK
jgi:hypothetical protein